MNEVGVCIYLDGRGFENSNYKKLEIEIEQPQFIVTDNHFVFCTAASGQVYGRELEIVIQSDAAAVKENYWNQMNQLLFYGCLFSVLGAIINNKLAREAWQRLFDELGICISLSFKNCPTECPLYCEWKL